MTWDHQCIRARSFAFGGVLAALVLAGCGGGGSSSSAPPPRTIVSRAITHTADLKSFHFSLKVDNAAQGSGGLTITSADGDVVVPDRLKASVNGTFARAPVQTSVVVVGGKSFLQDPLTKKWEPFPLGSNPAVLVRSVPNVLRRADGLKNDGTESVGGADTYKVSGTVPASVVAPLVGVKPGNQRVAFTIWVGQKDFILRRARLQGPVASGEPSDIARTVELSKFNEPVTITPPATGG